MSTKADIVAIFRERLLEAFEPMGQNPTAFCKAHGIDRTTFAQLTSPDFMRLPRADTVVQLACALNVSADWLLGLSESKETGLDILSGAVEMVHSDEEATAEYIWARWHEEAQDSKIRSIPVTVPVPLKTKDFFIEEYTPLIGKAQAKKEYKNLLHVPGEYEVAIPIQTLYDLRNQSGFYRNFSKETCLEQLEYIAQQNTKLYPTARFYIFDLTETYVPSFTIFGYLKAAMYLDEKFIVYNSRDYVLFFRDIFNDIIRSSIVRPHELTDFIYKELLK